ncbi:MAG: type II secretion system protein [bacterium]|nr:type II secretion system protein [bacterium]
MKRGFTLIELIVSIALLSLLVFGVASLFPRAVGLIQRSSSITSAANLAQAQVETVLTQTYEGLTIGTYEARHFVDATFERKTEVSYIDPSTLGVTSSDLGIKRAEVTVYYSTVFGQKTLTLQILITKK